MLKKESEMHFFIFLVIIGAGLVVLFACYFLQSYLACKSDRKHKEHSRKLKVFREVKPIVKDQSEPTAPP